MRTPYTSRNEYRGVIRYAFLLMLLGVMPTEAAFMIRPMVVELGLRPGRRNTQVLKVANESVDESINVTFARCDVTQNRDGSWRIIEEGEDLPEGIATCKDWIGLPKNQITIPPLGLRPLIVTLQVPPRIRGFYSGGLIATEELRPGATGVPIKMRYLLPFLIEIQGRSAPHKVELTDVDMVTKPADMQGPATTLVSLQIENIGETYARLNAFARVQAYQQGHWYLVSESEYEPLGIFPNIELDLKKDIEQPLPSGTYKVTGMVMVDGRRIPALAKTMEFVGDPSATRAKEAMKLGLDPEVLFVDTRPGAMRSASIRVSNPSSDPLNVEAQLVVPNPLSGTLGDFRGTELSCVDWVEISPAQFTLPGRGGKSVRVIVRMPDANPSQLYPNYYAQLNLRARYSEGQNAGLTEAVIGVSQSDATVTPRAAIMALSPRHNKDSEYFVMVKYKNTGLAHFQPRCFATLSERGGSVVSQKLLQGSKSVMLPVESRTVSALFDFSAVATGVYRLSTTLELGEEGPVESRAIPIRVGISGSKKTVTVIDQSQFEQEAGTKW